MKRFRCALLMVMVLAVSSCEIEPKQEVSARPMHYSDAVTQQQFKDALSKAGIPYTLEYTDSREFVRWAQKDNPAVEKLLLGLLAGPLPHGRYTGLPTPALHAEFTDWLTKKGIRNDTVTVEGKQYVIWHHQGDLVGEFFAQRKR